jgi:two-component system, NarL family, nitrate/nitrite response regulator NarL
MKTIRILLADDHLLFRKAIASLLGPERGYDVVGEAANGQEALALTLALRPDLILMDLTMPVLDGLEATREITAVWPEARIVILTMKDGDETLVRALKSGARGYLLKETSAETFFKTLRAVMRGEAGLSGGMAARVFDEFARDAQRASVPPPEAALTSRGREVLKLVSQGKSNKGIAATLFLAEATVKNHMRSILDKLHLENRVQAAAFALQKRLIIERPT